ncbi:MAG: hypothetical protein WD772_00485 [Pseudohongiellaceae bacterium]
MNRFIALLIFSLSFVSQLAFGQSDNCETLTQQEGIVSIPMQTGGRPTVAVLNTGVLPIGISRMLAQDLGLEVEPVPARNILWSAIPAISGQVSNVPIRIFNQDLQIEQMYVMDNPARFVYLSLLMFNDFIMQVNLPQSSLCFLNRSALNMREANNIEMKMANGRVAIFVSINEAKPVWLELQLEYPGAVRLNRDVAIELGLIDEASTATAGIADSLMFGPYELGNIALAYPPSGQQAGSELERLQRMARRGGGGIETRGVLGYEILKHFVVTLDTDRARMHVYVP